jgi:tartrate dehydrogenase/decarboxylase/D-malate dehydrogenase
MSSYRIALIPGDGIGGEVIAAATTVLDAVAAIRGFSLTYEELPWGSDYYRRTGAMMPADGIDQLRRFDAILLGAVGSPDLPDDLTLWGLLIPIRRSLSLYVNLRPIKLFAGIQGPLRTDEKVDIVVVRENVEGEYSSVGGRIYEGQPQEAAMQQAVFTRLGVERIVDRAIEYALARKGSLVSATKSNGITSTMPLWDQIVRERVAANPGIDLVEEHIDALCAKLVLHPGRFDVIVASNLFGDILSDLAAAVAGSIGIAPSANLNPDRTVPSMFEPVHGSAPDIAGRGIANPLGAIWSAALMVEHLGQTAAAVDITSAIERLLAGGGARTPDLGGTATTEEVTAALLAELDVEGEPVEA